jgi:hypothetical protein
MNRLTPIKRVTMLVTVVVCFSGVAAATAAATLISSHPLAGDSAKTLSTPDVCEGTPQRGLGKTPASPSPLCGGTPCSASGDVWWNATEPLGCGTRTSMAAFYGYDPRWTQDCPYYNGAIWRAEVWNYDDPNHASLVWNMPWRCSDGSWAYSTQTAQNHNLAAYQFIMPGNSSTTHWSIVLYSR